MPNFVTLRLMSIQVLLALTHVCLHPVQLWRLSPHEHVLLIVQHHSITDGMSLAVLNRDLAAAYTAVLRNMAPQWSPLPAAYIDYAAWQRQHYSGEHLQVQ